MTIWQLLARTTFTLLFILATGVGQAEELGAIGDSISTAMNADDVCDDAVECVENMGEDWDRSFATGDQSWSVRSRLLPFGFLGARTAAYNGAEWDDALPQAQELMALPGVSLVVIELGGNNVCQRLGEPLPSLDVVETHIDQTLTYLTDTLPSGGHVVVAEVPDVLRLREIMRFQPHFLFNSCQALWDLDYDALSDAAVMDVCEDLYGDWLCDNVSEFRNLTEDWLADLLERLSEDVFGDQFPCANVLNSISTEEAREAAAEFNRQLNDLLARKAREYTDRNGVRVLLAGGVYDHPYAVDDVSGLDCFHPSRSGQAYLANLIWPTIYDALTEPDCSADGYCNPDCRRGADPDCKKGKGQGTAQKKTPPVVQQAPE
jgi:lysophospholipase L1-like esterase